MNNEEILFTVGLMRHFMDNILFESDESGDSDYENEFQNEFAKLKAKVREESVPTNRIKEYTERIVPSYTNHQFQIHFRLTKESFEHMERKLYSHLSNESEKGGRPTVTPRKQLLAVIWLLSNQESYRSVGDRFNMGKSTLSHCFFRVVEALNNVSGDIIRWPSDSRKKEIKKSFYRLAKIPNVLGAIDGTYIRIKAPQEDPEVYINRKCHYGITLQAICDNGMKFMNCFAGYPSSVGDLTIFKNSDIYQKINQDESLYFPQGEYILGDKVYPVTNWCIPPYIEKQTLNLVQKHFNTQHAKTRQVIERAFALYFGRFRRMKNLDMNRTDWIPITIVACCVLHNICLNFSDNLIENYIEEGRRAVNMEERLPETENNQRAFQKRDRIANQLYEMRNRK